MVSFSLGQTLNNTIGAMYIGTIIAGVLYGLTCLQTYWYYHWYARRDTRLHRISVGVLWALDTTHLLLVCHGVYHYMVTGFGNFIGLLSLVWSLKLQVAVNVVIILLVQSLYTYRVWLLGGYHNGILGYLVTLVLAGGFAIGLVLAYEVYSISSFSEHAKIGWSIEASLVASTGIDFIIAGTMCYYLKKSKGRENHLNSRISTMMQFVLGSGFLTSATSTSSLIAYVANSDALIYLCIESFLTKLYINSFLAMLNARELKKNPSTERERQGLSIRISNFSSKGPILPTSIPSTSESNSNEKTSEPEQLSPRPHTVDIA